MTTPATNTTNPNVVARISGVGVEYVITTTNARRFDVISYCGPKVTVEAENVTWREAMSIPTDEIAAQVAEAIADDLVEVSPGAWLPSEEAARLFAQRAADAAPAVDKRVAKVRADHIVGRNTCSVIDECWTDAEIVARLDEQGITSPTAALRWARSTHRTFHSVMSIGGGF